MKPLELTLSSFGTFAEKCTINFEQLGKGSVFLITGDTGSGKTTIFDAICFALYGTASGENREKEDFRSHYTKDDSLTYVNLKFICNNTEYRITRNPAYLYRKTKKNGEVSESKRSANASLFTIKNGEEIFVCEGVKGVNKLIEDITGMNVDQFRRIIMIAQGEFQKLLFADSKEKEKILQKLFSTEPYKLVRDKIAERTVEIKRKLDIQRLNIISEFKRITPLDEEDKIVYQSALESESLMSENKLNDLCDMLGKSSVSAENTLTVLSDTKENLSEKINELRKEIAKGETHNGNIRKYRQKLKELEIIENKYAEASDKYHKAEKNTEKISELERESNICSESLENYDIFENLAKEVRILINCKSEYTSELSDQQQRLENLKNKSREITEYFENNGDTQLELEKIKSSINEKTHSLNEIKTIIQKYKEYKNALNQLKKCDNEYQEIYKIFYQEKAEFDELERNFYQSSAVNLALTLEKGYPCPVCGSKEHPSPAKNHKTAVTQEQYQKAKKLLENTNKKLNDKKISLEKQQSVSEQLKIDIDEDKIYEEYNSFELEIKSLNKQQHKLSNQLAQEIRMKNELKTSREEIEKLESDCNNIRIKLGETDTALAGKKSELEHIRKSLVYEDKKSAEAHIYAINNEISKYKQDLKTAEQNFRNLEINKKSLIENINELKKEINNLPEYDTASQTKELNELSAKFEKLSDNIPVLRKYCTDCKNIVENVRKLTNDYCNNTRKYNIYKELTDKLSGNFTGAERISFESFVQAYYLNNILDNANLKLSILSDGQYKFCRAEDEKRNQKTGLNIDVYDEHTDKKRTVKSLSGGEAFLASLSLALGLSDTVQQRSGGIRLDSIFIDEGFGSLDTEKLDKVVKILEKLSDYDRMTGIISHVSELSDRFDKKLIVKKGLSGSYVNTVI